MPKSKRMRRKRTAAEEQDITTRRPVLEIPAEVWQEIVSASNFLILSSKKDGIPRSILLLSRSKLVGSPETIPSAYRKRPETLRALSQTNRAFRSVFLPLLWEHVEACFEPKYGTAWDTRVVDVLFDRCTGLMERENRNLARHVRVFSVSLSLHEIDVVMPVFAQCLESLPNLDTLHIVHLQSRGQQAVIAAFEDIELPNVRTIILPSYAYAILAACPNVRDVSCNEETGTVLFDTLIECCPEVERIQGFELTSSNLKELSEGLTKLREIAIPTTMIISCEISSLSVLNRLSVIELIANCEHNAHESDIDDSDYSARMTLKRAFLRSKLKLVDDARAVLRASSGTDPKCVKMTFWKDIVGWVGMTEYTYGRYWVKTEEFDV
ncbi:hypothetical protein B0H11DRAFT_271773 [Mycena galericulata]|nr:hypothetical protein B0H11DRAFT_271773 [Mycena galericulata]